MVNDTSQRIFLDVVSRCRDEVLERATDWAQGSTGAAARARDEARMLVHRAIAAQTASLVHDDQGPLDELTSLVTADAGAALSVSELIAILASFRRALEGVLRREVADAWAALDVLAAVDQVAHGAACRAADRHAASVQEAMEQRRAELEESYAQMRDDKERELDEKIAVIERQREALGALAAPVIRVWEGVLVVPLIGEIDALRADMIREKVLQAVVATRAGVVLVEVTGLADVDERVASEVMRLVGCVRLLGSRAMLVGLSAKAARVLAALDVNLDQVPSFTTLHDALRGVLGEGLDAAPKSRIARPARAR
jgi:rsbT co-antagonist protein RsbR